jgi:nucleoside-diphosphate-sugar epimerase
VLVTGGSGFVGRPALGALARGGHDVYAVTTRPDPVTLEGVSWLRLDLADAAALDSVMADIEPDQLLHLAWYVEHGLFWEAPENVGWVERSLALLRSFAAHGGRRAVMLGSCAEYDWTLGEERFDEERSPLGPSTLYGVCKDALRRVASAYAEQQGIEFAWARLFFMYGPREPAGRLVPSVIRALLAGVPAEVTSGTQVRDFMHVEDVGRALVALLASRAAGAVNIGSGEETTLADVVDELARLSGAPELVRKGALADRPDEPARIVADCSRLTDEVGFSSHWSLSEGLADAVRWWAEQGATG